MSYGRRYLKEIEDILFSSKSPKIDLILNFMSFRLGSGPMGEDAQQAMELDQDKCPMPSSFFMPKRQVSEWKESERGISTSEFLTTVMLPEIDGSIETYPVGAITNHRWMRSLILN